MTQLSLSIPESGPCRLTAEDNKRLGKQLAAVKYCLTETAAMWWTLRQLHAGLIMYFSIHASEASISARLRDLRKPNFGGYTVERRRVEGGFYEYRVKL